MPSCRKPLVLSPYGPTHRYMVSASMTQTLGVVFGLIHFPVCKSDAPGYCGIRSHCLKTCSTRVVNGVVSDQWVYVCISVCVCPAHPIFPVTQITNWGHLQFAPTHTYTHKPASFPQVPKCPFWSLLLSSDPKLLYEPPALSAIIILGLNQHPEIRSAMWQVFSEPHRTQSLLNTQ